MREREVKIVALCIGIVFSPWSFGQFRLPKLPTEIPGLDKIEQVVRGDEKPDAAGTSILPTSLGCLFTGGVGAAVAKKYAEEYAEKKSMSEDEKDELVTSYMLGFGLAGCAVGGSVAAAIVNNMSESAKLAQEQAWQQAQSQTGAVEWRDPNDTTVHGTSELAEIEDMPSGQRCGTRRDVIEASEGKATPFQRVCQTSAGNWEPVAG